MRFILIHFISKTERTRVLTDRALYFMTDDTNLLCLQHSHHCVPASYWHFGYLSYHEHLNPSSSDDSVVKWLDRLTLDTFRRERPAFKIPYIQFYIFSANQARRNSISLALQSLPHCTHELYRFLMCMSDRLVL